MFKRIKGFKNQGVAQTEVDAKFEFFYHYWVTFNTNNNLLFFYETRFESHRSLLKKIEDQFKYNLDQSYDKFIYLFIKHILFSPTNIIAKKASIRNKYINILSIIDPTGSTPERQKKRNYNQNIENIKEEVKKIKSILLKREPYNMQIAKKILRILSTNTPLTSDTKNDLKFLINAMIVELYNYGYKLDYILKIPDILIFNTPHHNFPLEKTRADFSTDAKYERYKKQELKTMDLSKILSGLIHLIRRKKYNGYYVFKVDNITLDNPDPLRIGDIVFYNPQNRSMVNSKRKSKEIKKRNKEIEDFYYSKKGEASDESKKSKCNALIKSEFKAANNIESPNELYKAFFDAKKSLNILNNLANRFGKGNKGIGKIQFHKHFRLFDNKKIAGHSVGIYWDQKKHVEIKNNQFKDLYYFNQNVHFINKLDLSTELGNKIFTVISKRKELEEKDELFNFKDLWIAWEAIAKRSELIELAQLCFQIYVKKNFFINYKLFLSTKLREDHFFSNKEYYKLSDAKLKDIGLSIPFHKGIPDVKFRNNYRQLKNLIPTYFIKDLVSRMDYFNHSQSSFFQDLNLYLENLINEIYIERNMEIHSNHKNELSRIRLKNDFILLSRKMSNFLIDFTDKRNPNSFELTKGKIENYLNRL